MQLNELMKRTISSRSTVVSDDQPHLQDMPPNDWISDLPDEFIVDIISQLKMKQMVQTCVFSKRWRNLWKITRNLNFKSEEILHDLEVERPIYVRFVNEVIKRHQSPYIDQFIVKFSLNETSSDDIDSWVSFALRKRVQKLKLLIHRYGWYIFPHSMETSSCTSLTFLKLFGVSISGEVLEVLLCNCQNLEFVSVTYSRTLVNLNVNGPSLKLKWLELLLYSRVLHISLSAPNLVSFKYSGYKLIPELIYLPKLVELSIQGRYCEHIHYTLPKLFGSVISQLETLTYDACANEEVQEYMWFPEFTKLKYLNLVFTLPYGHMLLDYHNLIKAAPSLYKLTVQIPQTYKPDTLEPIIFPGRPHNIKVVEFVGFQGRLADTEFAIYLILNAVCLEKLVFDTRKPETGPIFYECYKGERDRSFARQRAEKLGERLSAGVELIII